MSELGDLGYLVVQSEFPHLTGARLTGEMNRASGWFEANLGQLNLKLYTSFSGVNPVLYQEEASIFAKMYLVDFYQKEAQRILMGVGDSNLEWISAREGDSTIQLLNKNEVAKTYRGISSDLRDELSDLVHKYLMYQSTARQVDVQTNWSGTYKWTTF